jgi:hypothetical protein
MHRQIWKKRRNIANKAIHNGLYWKCRYVCFCWFLFEGKKTIDVQFIGNAFNIPANAQIDGNHKGFVRVRVSRRDGESSIEKRFFKP